MDKLKQLKLNIIKSFDMNEKLCIRLPLSELMPSRNCFRMLKPLRASRLSLIHMETKRYYLGGGK